MSLFIVVWGWIRVSLNIWHYSHGIRRIVGILGSTLFLWGFLALTAPSYYPFLTELERPVGCTSNFIRLPDGGMAVLQKSFHHIQIYDSHGERFRQREWQFVRGWRIEGGKHMINMRLTSEHSIEVKTSSPDDRLIYALDGRLLKRSKYKYDSQAKTNIGSVGSRECVPTAIPLWPFIDTSYGLITFFAGIIILLLSGVNLEILSY